MKKIIKSAIASVLMFLGALALGMALVVALPYLLICGLIVWILYKMFIKPDYKGGNTIYVEPVTCSEEKIIKYAGEDQKQSSTSQLHT